MEDSPCHQEMVELAAVGSPEERNRLRDFTNIMLEHDSGTPGSPDDVQDDDTADQEEPVSNNGVNVNVREAEAGYLVLKLAASNAPAAGGLKLPSSKCIPPVLAFFFAAAAVALRTFALRLLSARHRLISNPIGHWPALTLLIGLPLQPPCWAPSCPQMREGSSTIASSSDIVRNCPDCLHYKLNKAQGHVS